MKLDKTRELYKHALAFAPNTENMRNITSQLVDDSWDEVFEIEKQNSAISVENTELKYSNKVLRNELDELKKKYEKATRVW